MKLFTFLADLRLARLVDELTQQLARQVYALVAKCVKRACRP